MHPPEGVVIAGEGLHQRSVRIGDVFADAVTGGIQGVDDLVAETVGHFHQPMCAVIGVVGLATIGGGDLGELPHPVVGEGGEFATDVATGEPAPWAVSQLGGDAIGVDDRQRSAVAVVGGNAGDVAERIGDAGEVAALAQIGVVIRVIGVGGDVPQGIGGAGLATVGGVSPGPGSGSAGGGCTEALAAVAVRSGLLDLAEQIAVGVIAQGGDLERFGGASD